MKFILATLLVFGAQAFAGENPGKPVDPQKELYGYGFRICSNVGGEPDQNACYFRVKDFIKANPVPCTPNEIAAYRLKLTVATCEEKQKVKDKVTGKKVQGYNIIEAQQCWKGAVKTLTVTPENRKGLDLKPLEVGKTYDLSKMADAIAYSAGTCFVVTDYLLGKGTDVDPDCMHKKAEELETAFALQGIAAGPNPLKYNCAAGAAAVAEGAEAPAKPEVQPRIVTVTADTPGAKVAK